MRIAQQGTPAPIAAALAALLLLSPVILVVAFLVRQKLGSPVFFRQTRPGLNARPFQMVKFRTMRDAVDAEGNPLPDEERMTRLGSLSVACRSTQNGSSRSLWWNRKNRRPE